MIVTLVGVCTTLIISLVVTSVQAGDLTVKAGRFEFKDGKPFRGIGVNYFDAINRSLNNPQDESALVGLKHLSRYEVPFVRVMFGGFWPNEMRMYITDRRRYFNILDRFVKSAEENRIGIVATLAWNYATIPDMVGEPASAWGQPNSKTLSLFHQYVEDVVGRYHQSPALWMWEFSNEMALKVDLPNANQWRPHIDLTKGTPDQRSSADDLTEGHQNHAMNEFARWVRSIDPSTPLSSGNSLPRPYAYNNRKDRSWQSDTREQFCEMLARDNPSNFDVFSVHVYPGTQPYFGKAEYDSSDIIAQVARCAKATGKPVFVGEFGVSDTSTPSLSKTTDYLFDKFLSELDDNHIGMSAVWVFDFPYQNSSFNITPRNGRAYQLVKIRDLNRRLRAVSK